MKNLLRRLTDPNYYITKENFEDRIKKMSLKLYEEMRKLQKTAAKNYDNKFDMVHDRVGDLEDKVDTMIDLLSKNLEVMKTQKPTVQERVIERVVETSTSNKDKVIKKKSVLPEDDNVGFIPEINTDAMTVKSKKKNGVVVKAVDNEVDVGSALDALDNLNKD